MSEIRKRPQVIRDLIDIFCLLFVLKAIAATVPNCDRNCTKSQAI